MKPIIILFTFLTLSFNVTNSQWVYQQVPSNASYYITIDFSSAQNGIAGGTYYPNFIGRGAFTINGGTNWQSSQLPDSCRVMVEVDFIDNTTGYCAGAYNTSLLTGPVDLTQYDKKTLRSLFPYSGSSGYKGLFMKTTNAGQSWFTYGTLPSNVYYLLGLKFVNAATGFALASYDYSGGVNDGVIKTTNAGLNWFALTMPENINSLNDIYFYDINTGYAVGYDKVIDTARGVILKTTNSGSSWSRQIFMQLREFQSIDFVNSTTGLAVSSENDITAPIFSNIYKTTNAGVNWILVSFNSDIDIHSADFVPGTGTALAYGSRNLAPSYYKDFVSKTSNYGNNWSVSSFNDTGLILMCSKFINQNNWYLAGGNFDVSNSPVILHTGNGAPIAIEQTGYEMPKYFSLSQNYPNPFNPSTKIKFAISGSSVAQTFLSVFDILGREVVVLVNEQLQPGTYEVEWDGSNYSTGIYFYKLTTSKFSDTKRMILIK